MTLMIKGTAMRESILSVREEGGITVGLVADIAEKALTQAQRSVHPVDPLKT